MWLFQGLVFTLAATFCSERTKCNNILLQMIFDHKGQRELLCMIFCITWNCPLTCYMGQVTNWPDKCLTALRDEITIVASATKDFYLLSFYIYLFFWVLYVYMGELYGGQKTTFRTVSLLQPCGFWRSSSVLEIHAFTLKAILLPQYIFLKELGYSLCQTLDLDIYLTEKPVIT